jgi:hypothetical protein
MRSQDAVVASSESTDLSFYDLRKAVSFPVPGGHTRTGSCDFHNRLQTLTRPWTRGANPWLALRLLAYCIHTGKTNGQAEGDPLCTQSAALQ